MVVSTQVVFCGRTLLMYHKNRRHDVLSPHRHLRVLILCSCTLPADPLTFPRARAHGPEDFTRRRQASQWREFGGRRKGIHVARPSREAPLPVHPRCDVPAGRKPWERTRRRDCGDLTSPRAITAANGRRGSRPRSAASAGRSPTADTGGRDDSDEGRSTLAVLAGARKGDPKMTPGRLEVNVPKWVRPEKLYRSKVFDSPRHFSFNNPFTEPEKKKKFNLQTKPLVPSLLLKVLQVFNRLWRTCKKARLERTKSFF